MATRGKYKPDSGRLEGEKKDPPQTWSQTIQVLRVWRAKPFLKAGRTLPHSSLMAQGSPSCQPWIDAPRPDKGQGVRRLNWCLNFSRPATPAHGREATPKDL